MEYLVSRTSIYVLSAFFLFLGTACQKKAKTNKDKEIVSELKKDTLYCQERIKDTLSQEFEASMYNESYTTTIRMYDDQLNIDLKQQDSVVKICSNREARITLLKKVSDKLIFDIVIKKEDLKNSLKADSIDNYVLSDIRTEGMARTNSLFYDVILTNKESGLKYETRIGVEYLKKNRLGQINFWSQIEK